MGRLYPDGTEVDLWFQSNHVLADGKPVLEEYAAGQTHESSHLLYSGTKSFFGVAVACMIQDGLIKSLDELACETLGEWKGDARREAITIRHLLDLTSGLDPAAKRELRRSAKDAYARAVELKCTSEPGTTQAAMRKNAADDRSPGTWMSMGSS